ncbi:MAG: Gx transporter family protein [Lachnospiraceae bacterium]
MRKKVAYLGMLVALAFIFSYVESLIPVNLILPGAKLGLANLVVMIALYTMELKETAAIAIVRIILTGFTFGNLASMLYSLSGGALSLGIMVLAKKTGKLSATGVSVLGGVFHNIGQILMAMIMVRTGSLVFYLPVLLISGIISGVVIGILAAAIIKRVKQVMKE